MAQILSDISYFSRRVSDEAARAKRQGTQVSIAVFTSQPAPGEHSEIACVTRLPDILCGVTRCVASAMTASPCSRATLTKKVPAALR